MALRALMLSKKIEQLREKIGQLREKDADFEKREKELQEAVEEISEKEATEEEVKAVEDEVEAFEQEKSEHEEEVRKLEATLSETEKELEEERSKNPTRTRTAGVATSQTGKELNEVRTGFLKNVSLETRDRFMQQPETRGFIDHVRELAKEKRSVTGAELTIPDNVLELLRDNMNRYSKLLSVITPKPLKGTARQTIAGTVPEGVWVEAIDSLEEIEVSFNQIEMDGYKVGGYLAMPNSTLEDSDLNLISELLDALGQAIGYALDKAILYGNKTKMPVGIVTRLAQTEKPAYWDEKGPEWTNLSTSNILKFAGASLDGAAFFKKLIQNLGVAKANYSDGKKFWCMNSTTKTEILANAVTFNAAGAIVAGVNEEMPVIGGKIIELDFIPAGDIIGGYASLYKLVERAGGKFGYSDLPMFIQDQTVFKGTARYDGKPVFGEGFVAVNINNQAVTTSITFKQGKVTETGGME